MYEPDAGTHGITLDLRRYNGLTIYDKNDARLEWTEAGRIRVVDRLPEGERGVFDAAPAEITKARLGAGPPPIMSLRTAQASVRLEYFRPMPTPLPQEGEQ